MDMIMTRKINLEEIRVRVEDSLLKNFQGRETTQKTFLAPTREV